MSTSVQLLAVCLTIPFLLVIVRLVRKRRLRAKYSFLWLGVGSVILAFTLIPGLMESLATTVGILYPPALLFLGAIMLLLFLSVHFSWELSRLEDRMRTLAEELAIAGARIDELEQAPPVDGARGANGPIEVRVEA